MTELARLREHPETVCDIPFNGSQHALINCHQYVERIQAIHSAKQGMPDIEVENCLAQKR